MNNKNNNLKQNNEDTKDLIDKTEAKSLEIIYETSLKQKNRVRLEDKEYE